MNVSIRVRRPHRRLLRPPPPGRILERPPRGAVKEVGPDYAERASIGPEGPSLLFLQVPDAKAGKNASTSTWRWAT